LPNQQPLVTDTRGRQFACSAAGVLAFIIDDQERFLLLSSPKRPGRWEVVNGALNAGETLLDGAIREIREEAGASIQVRPLGVVHAYTFRYDDIVQYMISIAFLFAYQGGEVIPGDDMGGSGVAWFTVEQIERGEIDVIVPQSPLFMFRHAVELYRLLKDKPDAELQPLYDASTRNKYSQP
jgi:ADP-ribose pyrophosphatase YjhB (NUDIX family)